MGRSKQYWEERLGKSWTLRLKDTLRSDYGEKLVDWINERYSKEVTLPEKENIFKAFRHTPFEDVKVVIIGQDPYPDGNATGLAFGNNTDKFYFNPSLMNIFHCIEEKFYNGLTFDFDWTLESWANQGVLLLNTALTVKKGYPGSHSRPWVDFIKAVIQALNNYSSGIIFMLWGNHAKKVGKLVSENHYKLECEHPVAASYGLRPWRCDNFEEANKILLKNNNLEIKW